MTDEYEDEQKEETPEALAKRWEKEFDYANQRFEDYHKQAERALKAFLDKKSDHNASSPLNLFHANTTTLKSMLFGRTPKVDVDRRYVDANDDVARVASEIVTRMLNADINEPGDDFSTVLASNLEDKIIVGLGAARVRYDFKEGTKVTPAIVDPATGAELAPAVEEKVIEDEWVDTVYIHWKDVRWNPCRYWSEVKWIAFRGYYCRDELVELFGDDMGKAVPLNAKSPLEEERDSENFHKAEVWEIWDKECKKVYHYTPGFDKILKSSDPPLDLEDFFPMPIPMMSNTTSSEMIPKPDYAIAESLYREIDILQDRISLLTEACKLVGVYDKNSGELKRLLNEGNENVLIPVENWGSFAEKGGLAGIVEWLPLKDVVGAIDVLTTKQQEKINQLYQVTGMSDILRGGGDPRTSATQDGLKAKFASVRIQSMQDEFARFATGLQKLKFEIISKYFQPETIARASNIQFTTDGDIAPKAIEFIKDWKSTSWRINIAPENLAMVDFSQLRQERTEYIDALGIFLQSAAPIAEKFPEASPVLLELLKWGLAGFKGSRQIEGILDKAVAAIMKQLQAGGGKQPDPEVMKMQQEMKLKQEEHQMKMQQNQQKFALDMQTAQQEAQLEMKTLFAKFNLEMQKLQAQLQALAQKGALERENMQGKLALEQQSMENQNEYAEAEHTRKMAEAKAKPKEKKSDA